MNRTLWIGASGMETQQVQSDTIANNIANVSTCGYKRSIAQFQDMLYQTQTRPGSETSISDLPTGIQIGTGVRTASVSKYFGQGSLQQSSADLDLALQGEGFFQIQMPDGTTQYTRNGSFHVNQNGIVVNIEGYPVTGFPNLGTSFDSITIANDGTVNVYASGANTNVGRIQIARFTNPEGLYAEGYNRFSQTEASGTPTVGYPTQTNFGDIAQHYLEESNVDIVKEMVNMITCQRAYELNSKSVRTAEEMLRVATNLKA